MKKLGAIVYLLPLLVTLTACDFTKKEPKPDAKNKSSTVKAGAASKAAPSQAKATDANVKLVTPRLPAAQLSAKELELQKAGGGIIIHIDQIEMENLDLENTIQIAGYFAAHEDAEIFLGSDAKSESSKEIMQIFGIKPKSAKVASLNLGFQVTSTNSKMKAFAEKSLTSQEGATAELPGYLVLLAGYEDSASPESGFKYVGTSWLSMKDLMSGNLNDSDRSTILNIVETSNRIEYLFELKDYGEDESQAGTLARVKGSIVVIKPEPQKQP